jgi:malate dehydrogenase
MRRADVKVLVVGNPANTNCADRDVATRRTSRAERFTRDDAARSQPRHRPAGGEGRGDREGRGHEHDDLGQPLGDQYPDIFHAKVSVSNAAEVIADQDWLENDFIPTVQKRGAAIIEARGASSAASAANAAIDHVHDWVLGTAEGDWVSMAIPSDGSYAVSGGNHLELPGHHLGRVLRGRPGARDRRVLAVADRRHCRLRHRGRTAI